MARRRDDSATIYSTVNLPNLSAPPHPPRVFFIRPMSRAPFLRHNKCARTLFTRRRRRPRWRARPARRPRRRRARRRPIFTVFALIVTGPENVSEPPKLSVRCEPFATAAAARLPSETAFVGRPPSMPAERASMPKPMKRAPFCCPYQCVSQRPFFGGTDEGRSALKFGR